MEGTLFSLHALFGFSLVIAGIVFDFAFVTTDENFHKSLGKRSVRSLWKAHAYGLVRSYLFVLGFLNLALALFAPFIAEPLASAVFALTALGQVLLIGGGLWEARSGPPEEWTLQCYILGAGLAAILLGIALEIYALAA